MSKRTVSPVRPTAAQVREFFRADEKRQARLSEVAAHTVAKGARGRLHPEVIAAYNKGRKPERRYVLGVGREVKAERDALRAKAVEMGAGRRGPLPKAVKEALSQSKG